MPIQYSGYVLNLVPGAVEVTGRLTAPKKNPILWFGGHKFSGARRISREKIEALHSGPFYLHEHRVTQYLSIFTVGGPSGVAAMYTLAPHEHSRRTE